MPSSVHSGRRSTVSSKSGAYCRAGQSGKPRCARLAPVLTLKARAHALTLAHGSHRPARGLSTSRPTLQTRVVMHSRPRASTSRTTRPLATPSPSSPSRRRPRRARSTPSSSRTSATQTHLARCANTPRPDVLYSRFTSCASAMPSRSGSRRRTACLTGPDSRMSSPASAQSCAATSGTHRPCSRRTLSVKPDCASCRPILPRSPTTRSSARLSCAAGSPSLSRRCSHCLRRHCGTSGGTRTPCGTPSLAVPLWTPSSPRSRRRSRLRRKARSGCREGMS